MKQNEWMRINGWKNDILLAFAYVTLISGIVIRSLESFVNRRIIKSSNFGFSAGLREKKNTKKCY